MRHPLRPVIADRATGLTVGKEPDSFRFRLSAMRETQMTKTVLCSLVLLCVFMADGVAQTNRILKGVKAVQVNPTVIGNPDKVKEDYAATLMEDSLRNALKDSNFEVADADIRAHIVLDEFTSGSTAKRVLVGFGAGRSTVDGRLVFTDAEGKQLANVQLRVRGNFWGSGYQGGNTQRRQATNAFDQRLVEEIARLK
jgi:hypothetical protein